MSASTLGLRQFLVITSILILSLNGKTTTNETSVIRINATTELPEGRSRITTTKGESFMQFFLKRYLEGLSLCP